MTNRVSIYIDGYNLYCGIRQKYGKKWLWLDIGLLAKSIIRPDQSVVAIHYCTARTRGAQESWWRQDTYWKALGTVPHLKIHEGFHQRNKRWCPGCRTDQIRHEEKQTDSRIASLLVADAMADRTDTLILIGGDSDHVPPVQTVKAEAPKKDILVCWPPSRKSNELFKAVGKDFYLSENLLRKSQFPNSIVLANGSTITRPADWSASK